MRDASQLALLRHRALSLRGDAVPVKRRPERVLRIPRNENAFMTTKTWSRRWLFAGFIATVLLALWAVMSRSDSPSPSPMTAASRPAAQMPVAAAPARARTTPPSRVEPVGVRQDYIVQAESVEVARSAVMHVGGVVTGELSIIRAVGAALDDRELEALHASDIPRLRIFEDAPGIGRSNHLPETNYPSEVAASNLHLGGVTGRGVTVSVLASGVRRTLRPPQTTPSQTPPGLAPSHVLRPRPHPP